MGFPSLVFFTPNYTEIAARWKYSRYGIFAISVMKYLLKDEKGTPEDAF